MGGSSERRPDAVIGRAIVAGHICLDILPRLTETGEELAAMLSPGTVTEIGSTLVATGGAVANVGVALHRLGVPVRLSARVGEDLFGRAIGELLAAVDSSLPHGLIASPADSTSYSIVLSARGSDRTFLHFPGANDLFRADDLSAEAIEGCDLLHFGYPPAMRSIYRDGGAELVALLERAKAAGLTTSLDMSYPPPGSEASLVDWRAILGRALPLVDLFIPGVEEISSMLQGGEPGAAPARGAQPFPELLQPGHLRRVAAELLEMGCALCVLKLGSDGLYVRTTGDPERIAGMGRCAPRDPADWIGRELHGPCFAVRVVGTTGAGDCTAAGFIAGLLHRLSLPETVTSALAAGACAVEGIEATATIPGWDALTRRIAAGWPRAASRLSL